MRELNPWRASITPVRTAEAFSEALASEKAALHVRIETWREATDTPGWTNLAVKKEFERRIAEMPHDLRFRAYSEAVEYGWHGDSGTIVRKLTIGESGAQYDVRPAEYRSGGEDSSPKIYAHEISLAGRVIYRKLRPQPGTGGDQ